MENEKILKAVNELLTRLKSETEPLFFESKLSRKQKKELKDKLQAYNSLLKIWDYYEH